MSRDELRGIEVALCAEAARLLSVDLETVDPAGSLGELGMDSVGYVEIACFIQKRFGVALRPETLFEHNSIRQTAACVLQAGAERTKAAAKPAALAADAPRSRDVAVIGAAFRLPGAKDFESLYALVSEGGVQLKPVPPERWGGTSTDEAPRYLKGGLVEDVDRFDAAFFGISPREAIAMDPQQRLLMECAWHAFEDAGYAPAQLSGSDTAVFIGASAFDYYELLIKTGAARATHIGTGVSHAILANRLSQYYNLRGASEAIDTACSSSLVALWRGVEALRRGESGMALVGGVNIFASLIPFQAFAEAGMLSKEGRCLPFDARAAGYVRGEGVVCVVMKAAHAALRDGDRVLALIKGGAVRHSGRTQSLTAPNPEAQADVVVAAVEDAQVDAGSIGYVEAHGTGTALGDPIEIRGLRKAFARLHGGRADVVPHFCIGSIKAQIGHLEAAAGLAGVLKAMLCLQRGKIPGNALLSHLNPLIELHGAPFRILARGLSWEGQPEDLDLSARPRRAGVSSFGFGGTNAHVVLEEPPALAPRASAPDERFFLLSARDAEALRRLSAQLAMQLVGLKFEDAAAEQTYLEDLAFTLRRGRSGGTHRLAVLAASRTELAARLNEFSKGGVGSAGVWHGEAKRGRTVDAGAKEDAIGLAKTWVRGAEVDWLQALPRSEARIVPLPPYPFAGERFWPSPDGRIIAEPGVSAAARHWVGRWEPLPYSGSDPLPLEGDLLAIVGGERGRAVAAALSARLGEGRVQVLAYPELGESARGAAEMALSKLGGPLTACLDLSALDENGDGNLRASLRMEFLRCLLGPALKRGEPLRVLQVTQGLQDLSAQGYPPRSLAGAALNGLYEFLGAEYKRCHSKTVDFSGAQADVRVFAACLVDELSSRESACAIAYAGDKRLTRVFEPRVTPPVAAEPVETGGVAVITGGTGEIGLLLARDLAQRGFRALLLAGRRELSADKETQIGEIETMGVAVARYRGELEDAVATAQALDAFRAAHGPITHVFHCAGAADTRTPAFYEKTAKSIAPVLSPKVNALQVLHSLFREQPPRAFVLFSSVSAVAPHLAAGALDYAAANRYLDLFSHYQRAHGCGWYLSLQWTLWQDTGLARRVRPGPDSTPTALPPALCLDALHRVLASEDAPPSVCVLAEGDSLHSSVSHHRKAEAMDLAKPAPIAPAAPAPHHLAAVLAKLRVLVAEELETTQAKLDDEASFEELGIDSIVLMGLVTSLEQRLDVHVEPQALIGCNSIAAMARYLAARVLPEQAVASPPLLPASSAPAPHEAAHGTMQSVPARQEDPFRVAVIGMACRVPGARDTFDFWRNLAGGVDSVTEVPLTRWNADRLYADKHVDGRTVSRWGGFIEDIEWVYPRLFGMTAEEAADVDPLVRLFTECSLAALADGPSGIDGARDRRVGVFVGARSGRYAERITVPSKRSVTGVGQNFISAYVSHVLSLHGPNLVVDSACSSSLLAIHLACQSLRCGEADWALAGGVEILLDEKAYLFLSASHALSPDGRCRPFSAQANGFVPGEGVGCVLVKPLARALADGDPIYAVIEGSAVNNDGHTLGITTPGSEGQVDVIERALRNAGVRPRDISYVETHGTGTLIGDPIELQSLARAFQADPPARCAVGSVKSNFGHLLSAAGVASFIKVALAIHQETLPPTLHCEHANPRFAFDRTPFYPVRTAHAWDWGGPRRAGISAFGFGKTNVHMILGERPVGARVPQLKKSPPLPVELAGERVYAWRDPPQHVAGAARAERALLALEDVVVENMIEDADPPRLKVAQ